jgi:uncharacterized protein YcaQ
MMPRVGAAEARRIFLAAQGLARRRPAGRVGERQFREYLDRQGVLQLDSVNVFARAHYLPLFSRYGAYDTAALDRYLWGSGETFEHWGHEASVMPRELLPTLHFRMSASGTWKERTRGYLERERPGLIAAVEAAVRHSGPLSAADLAHLAPDAVRQLGSWWNSGDVKIALEYLFITGRVAVASRPHFQRRYDDPVRVWGRQAREGALHADEARQELFDRSLPASGIGTPKDFADHFRLPVNQAARLADSAVERGLAAWVEVEGWGERALLAAAAADPARATGAALLSPFDPVCRYRDRLLRMFGMHYRIEIYTPGHKREFGYYTLPFLLGDQIVGRLDLKADRKAKALLVQASWREEAAVAGARRRTDDDIAAALATELRLAADWLGLDAIAVAPRGNLAPALSSALRCDGGLGATRARPPLT